MESVFHFMLGMRGTELTLAEWGLLTTNFFN